ncbi:MAG: carbohydrate ABC transporter permease [Pseudopedobacter sp.]|nr:carbohydrate ABC transporter permease [Deinococcales bacterium]
MTVLERPSQIRIPTRARVLSTLSKVWTYVLLSVILLFAVFPFLWTLAISLTDKTVVSGVSIYDFPSSLFPSKLTLNNFVDIYQKFGLGKYIVNSIIISSCTVVGTLLVASLAAYPLARLHFPFRNFILALILATLVLPSETNFIVNIITLRNLGILGTYAGVVLPVLATAFGIFVMRGAYLSIPETLLEAARIDGATELQIWWRVMLPLSVPSITALAIFTLVGSWNDYFWPSLALITNENLHPLAVAMLKLKGQFNYDPFNVAAGAMIMMLPVLVVFLAAQRYFMRGLDGAVKG